MNNVKTWKTGSLKARKKVTWNPCFSRHLRHLQRFKQESTLANSKIELKIKKNRKVKKSLTPFFCWLRRFQSFFLYSWKHGLKFLNTDRISLSLITLFTYRMDKAFKLIQNWRLDFVDVFNSIFDFLIFQLFFQLCTGKMQAAL